MKRTAKSISPANFLAKSVVAGQTNTVVHLGSIDLAKHSMRQLIQRLTVDEHLQWADECTTVPYGITVPGFACWADTLGTIVNGYTYRHRLLCLCRPSDCRLYAIPMSMVERKFILPDIELADGELEAYKYIADRISPKPDEITIKVTHPSKAAIKANRDNWKNESLDLDGFSDTLKANAEWLYPILIAALDTQLRSFDGCDDIPVFCYNFTLKKVSLQADSNFIRVLTAMNFTVQDGSCSVAPREIIIQDSGDLKNWSGCHDRLIILRTVKGSGLTPIFDKLDTYDRSRAYKGVLPPRLSTVPIIRSKTFFDRPDTLDCELPDVIPSLTTAQLSGLRTAFSRALTRNNATDASTRWHERMRSPYSFLRNPFEEWRNALLDVFLDSIFPNQSQAKEAAETDFQTAQKRQKEAEEERQKILQNALDLVTDQSRYEDEIIDTPTTPDEGRKLLNIEQSAVAFRYVRKHKNGDVNHYIIFTDFSLLRLLKRVDLTEELYGPFKERALKAGVMIMKSACARLHSQSLSGHYWIRYADDPSDLSHASLMQEMSKAVKTVSDNN